MILMESLIWMTLYLKTLTPSVINVKRRGVAVQTIGEGFTHTLLSTSKMTHCMKETSRV
jgi:hypothetical protein